MKKDLSTYKIAVFGLGYVGLPLALGLAQEFPGIYGYDLDKTRIEELKNASDRTNETDPTELKKTRLSFTSDTTDLTDIDVFIVAVPTPINSNRQPDLFYVRSASEAIAGIMKKGAIVVFESTVYPGVTEDICGPVIEKKSGLKQGVDFHLGYSPERINPGDREHTIEKVIKVVAGDTPEITDILARIYGSVVKAGIHKAPSIRVAEAAKVIENTQRDINIALMNELALIFDRIGLSTRDVLIAAGTKWNFLKFTPGLVGGHCIGVDPYYLTSMAESVGYHPQIILAGRRINDGMGAFIAQKIIKSLIKGNRPVKDAKIGILGLTFKEDVPDIRNSKVPDIIAELGQYGIKPLVHDPMADAKEVAHEYGLQLASLDAFKNLDVLVLAVPHRQYLAWSPQDYTTRLTMEGGIMVDVKSTLSPGDFKSFDYWNL
ncbi:MAG: nucleotide sugar dehydrogenase [Alphaproteobacteria bacterium]